jgi:feruloyl esterase
MAGACHARQFSAVASGARKDPHIDLHEIGGWLYSPGYEAWCRAGSSQLVCKGGNTWSSYRKTQFRWDEASSR